ncbi:MAG: hypothetical protein Q9172_002374 [Xanthocarpia lactea]
MSFANNFWGKDDAGVQPLLERMHNAKVTCDELKTFYNTRAAIEDEYSRKLLALCRKPLGSSEAGTLRASLDVVRGEVESMGKAHQGIAAQMKSELEEPLTAFAGGMKERRKIVQAGVEKLYKIKQQQTQSVNKSRDKYEQDCLKIKGYLAQGHMVMGQEERKNKAKMEKTQIQLASTSNEYEATVKALEETTGRWNRDWKAACDKFQDLEEERLDFTKSSLWTFANVASTVCVSDDASCEKMRLSLESCEVEKDISSFIQERGTGQEIPDPPKYVNFCRGDLNDTASETSEDDNYSVAQFQRTLNPAFRTSSPQPSTYESHHDPQSDLAVKMGHLQAHTPPSRETTLTPQKAAHQAPPIIDYRAQSHTQAPYQHKIDDLAPVPHNEYPTNGMTMFCRTAPPPSDRSSATSPMRPSSRDSQSEYSNPTSFSSQEPPSGKQSPFKQDISMSPTKQVQKKRSGFFSNSPFRRKSKHEKDGRECQQDSTIATPTSRNTWGASTRNGASNNPSPTRPSGPGIQTRDFQNEPSPEPVDPRANFQLNVGPNVFDVASPDRSRHKPPPTAPATELDPIAQALADLKGVGKQSSVRMSADRYAGVATPGPGMASDLSAAQRGTPPPSYHDQQPVRRLDLPKPAFTSAQMKQTTRNYVGQNQDMYGSSRPGTRGNGDVPRAASPLPMRSTSPRPGYDGQKHMQSASPNPNIGAQPRHTPKTSPGHQPYTAGHSSRYNSPNDIRRSASPQPQYTPSSRQQQQRPNSSAGLQLQLAPEESNRGVVSQRARGQSNARPMTYYGGQQAPPSVDAGTRNRSRSAANGRQYSKDGRPILEFARALYLYNAAIPEELSFAKGDVLAVLNMQDDGWWEAEVTGKNGRPGLVPSISIRTGYLLMTSVFMQGNEAVDSQPLFAQADLKSAWLNVQIKISTAVERISSISNEVSLTSGVLQQLSELMTTKATHDGTTIFSQGGLDTTRKSAAMCENIFKDIDQAAKDASQQIRARRKHAGGKIKLTNSEKLKWPFLQPSIASLRTDLENAKGTLMLMLQVTSLAFSKKMADMPRSHQTASTNIVEQREIIDAILTIQKQQNDIESSKSKRLLVSSSSCNTPATATQDNLDEQSTLAQNGFPDTTPALAIRPHILAAMPPRSPPITRTKPGSDHSSPAAGVVLTPSESTISDGAEGAKTLEFFLMKPTIKDLGDVIQLSWKIHKLRMQQAEILNHISNNEQEGLAPVHETYQALYTHEHVALEDEISRAGAGSYVSLRSMKRIYTDLTHREILFKGIPGLQFVLECIIQRPPISKSPQASLFIPAQSGASGQLRSKSSGESKKTTLDDTINGTSNPSSYSRPFGEWFADWKANMGDVPAAGETGRTLRRKPKMVVPSAVETSANDSETSNQAHEDEAEFHKCPTGARIRSRNVVRRVNPQFVQGIPQHGFDTLQYAPAKIRKTTHCHEPSASSTQIPVMQGMSLDNQGNTGAKWNYSENYDDSEDEEDMNGQGMDDKEAERIVEELLGNQADESLACEWLESSILAPRREALDAKRKDTRPDFLCKL